MLFNELNIAQAEYQTRNAKYNRNNEVEGVTVVVPSIVERALQALRTALAGRPTAAQKPHIGLTHGVAAK